MTTESSRSPWLVAIAVMLATFMEVLDTSIAAVALPYIAGSLSASNDEATWVLTSYLVANATILPASSWFSLRFGRKRFLIICITIFTISSFACGAAHSLAWILIARAVQGAGGGALQPLSQSILLETFPPEKRGAAMAVFALGVVVAPVLGPTLGGWLTDTYSWRWAFYINIPVGIFAIFMISRYVEDPSYIKNARPGKFDGIGLGLLAIWLGCLQIILDKGQEDDWFGATWIRWAAAILATSFVAFLIRELRHNKPLVDSGTKTQPEPNPLIRMAHKKLHWPIDKLTSPNHKLAAPNREKPNAMSQRLSILAVRKPIMGMAIIAPMPRGLTAQPAASAV